MKTKLNHTSAAKNIATHLNFAIQHTGSATLAVCGGRSILPLFERLSKINIRWNFVTICLTDERLVNAQNHSRNEYLVKKCLIKNHAEKANFISIEHKNFNTEFKASNHNAIVLSMGEDGHIGSLFPDMLDNYDAFEITAKSQIIHTSKNGLPKVNRITMNLSMILKFEMIYLLVCGDARQKLLRDPLRKKNLPVDVLMRYRKNNIVIVN